MHDHTITTVQVPRAAVRQRVARVLKKNGRRLVHRRGQGWFLIDLSTEKVINHYPTEPDWVQWAEDAGVLQPWETVEVGA